MALTGTDRGTSSDTTAGTSFTLSPASNLGAGSWAVLVVSADNAGSSGAAMATFSVTDSLGNTWTRRRSPLRDPGAANAGVEGGIFTTDQAAGTLTTGTTITVSFGATSVTAKTWTLTEVAPDAGNTVSYVTGAENGGSSTNAPTVTTSSIPSGDMVIGALFSEGSAALTGDSDTSNGSWSTAQGSTAGISGARVGSQFKVVTGTAAQTFNPTLSLAQDTVLSWIQLHESAAAGTTVTPPTLALTTASFAPVLQSQIVGASPTALALTTFAPIVSVGQTVTPSTATLVTAAFAPVLRSGIVVPVATLVTTPFAPVLQGRINGAAPTALVTTGFAPSVVLGTVVVPSTATLVTAAFAPQLKSQITVPLATLVTAGFAPVIQSVITVPLATLVTAAFAPTITVSSGSNVTVTPDTAALVLTAFAPQLNSVVPVPLATLVTAAFAPVLRSGVVVPVATLVTASFAPQLKSQITVPVATLVTAAFAPVLKSGIVVPVASLATASFAPQLKFQINVPLATLVLTSFVPQLKNQVTVPATALVLGLFVPTISIVPSASGPVLAVVGVSALTLTGFAPLVQQTIGGIAGDPLQRPKVWVVTRRSGLRPR